MNIISEAKSIQDEIVKWRQQLHKVPEIGFELHQTTAYVQKRLDEMGIGYRVAAETGIVAIIKGDKPGPTIALRADMDALPLEEKSELPFAAKNGNMHACGHDAHMAILLGAAKIINSIRQYLPGNVKLLFQPGEEGFGGAAKMIEDGCLKDPAVEAVVALHVGNIFRDVKTGQIGYCEGPMLAATTAFEVVVRGSSCHGAKPNQGVDSIVIAAEIILALQKIVSRETDPLNHAVLTVGMINGGTAMNIVTDRVVLKGDFRTLTSEDRDYMIKRITEIAEGVAVAGRAEAEVNILSGYPPTTNDPEIARKIAASAAEIVSADNVIEIKKPSMGAEDMSLYMEKIPGAMFALGTGNEDKKITYPHHHPQFDLDEDVLWIGAAVFIRFVCDYFLLDPAGIEV